MSTPITNVPQGILSLLGLRDFGQVPRFCDLNISPGIDVTQFLLLNREEVRGVVSFTGVTGLGAPETTVPPGELWYIHNLTVVSAVLAAGETLQIQPTYIWGNRSFVVGDNVRATAGHRSSGGAWNSFWLPAGGTAGVRSNEFTSGGAITVSIDVNFTRLRV